MKATLKKRGAHGIRELGRAFRIADKNHNDYLSRHEFVWAMKTNGHQLTKTEFDKLFKYFDFNGDDQVDFNEFMRIIRGDLNEGRIGVINEAFAKLDKTGDGLVKLEDLIGVYNASKHPDVNHFI